MSYWRNWRFSDLVVENRRKTKRNLPKRFSSEICAEHSEAVDKFCAEKIERRCKTAYDNFLVSLRSKKKKSLYYARMRTLFIYVFIA